MIQQTIDCFLKYQPILASILIVVGWVVMFLYTIYQVRKSHSYNLKAQDTLFKQEIEYKAYCKIQDALDQYSSALINFDGYIRNLNIHLSLLKEGKVLRSDWANIPRELIEVNSQQTNKFIEFLKVYDSNEITVLDFKPIRDEIVKEANNLGNSFYEFHKCYLEKIDNFSSKGIPPIENINEMKDKTKAICEKVMDIVCYVYDFRIEMQNKILGPILGKSVPKREPGDKSVRVLSLD
ncbi:MAG: hypothetical protein AB1629_08475 [Candidatus Omnitrophota bacterium]